LSETSMRTIDFGGTSIIIRSSSPKFLQAVDTRYLGFLTNNQDSCFTLDHEENETAFLQKFDFLSHIDWKNQKACFASEGLRGTEIADGVLRVLLPVLANPDLVVHGALLEINGGAVLCCGKPGAGKSTIAALFPKAALCDELCRVHVGAKGIEARSLPFWQARPARKALLRIYVLEHGERNVTQAMTSSEAMQEMHSHIYWPLEPEDHTQSLFETMSLLVSRVPVFRLSFRPEPSVWELLRS